ncbi:MAG: DVU_1553 family AMP-dependent CoA ligase [Dehalococcoidia bacterium]
MLKTPLDDWIAAKIGLPPGALPRQAIESYQLARLRKTVALAKERSAFYRSQLAGIDPDGIVNFTHFAELPFTNPQDIRANPYGLLCTPQTEIERIVSLQSSGTTGEPKRFYFTKEDQELTIDFFDYGMRNLVGPSDRIMILLPWELPGSVGDLLKIALTRMGAHPIPYGPVYNAADAIDVALKQKATSMVGIPTHVLRMARNRSGGRLKGLMKSVLLTTDHVPDSISRAVEDAWGCKVFNHYGTTEMGLGGGVQCAARSCYHMREADLYFEIIDPGTGRPLPEGETGEIVFTTLTRQGMPLIRYRIGDLSRFVPGTCPCGSTLRQMDIVRGRVSGMKKLVGRPLTIAELDEAIFQVEGVLNFQCELSEDDGEEILTVDVLIAEGNPTGKDALSQEVQRALYQIPAVAEGLDGGRVKVAVNILDTQLPISKGTAKRTIADRRPGAQDE